MKQIYQELEISIVAYSRQDVLTSSLEDGYKDNELPIVPFRGS